MRSSMLILTEEILAKPKIDTILIFKVLHKERKEVFVDTEFLEL